MLINLFIIHCSVHRTFWGVPGLLMAARLQQAQLTGERAHTHTHTQQYNHPSPKCTKHLLYDPFIHCLCVSRFVYVWDTTSRRILYKLPGHAGSVNEVAFHPEEPIGERSLFYIRVSGESHALRVSVAFFYCGFNLWLGCFWSVLSLVF